jgi:MOSC domain-containing protein YiiM
MTEGRLAHINKSTGGVPKIHVLTALITIGGVEGDRQADAKHHGGPDRAICLYSLEHIRALQEEGHPICPGSVGENLTLAGVAWDRLIPGVSLDVGQARLMVTSYTTPCRTIRESFTGHHISRISQKFHPGWSRVCAKVLHPGLVTVDDEVSLLS